MQRTAARSYVRVPKEEYRQLKSLKRRFEDFLKYLEHVQSVTEARRDVAEGRTIPQEKLFKQLGI